MKRIPLLSTAIALALLFHASAYAGGAKMVFWYPGEAGSTEEAQPVIDAFFAYLGGKLSPDTISGRYFNTVEGGAAYIRKEKSVVGIVSFAAWAQHKAEFPGAAVMLSTLPLPGGEATERYALVGATGAIPAGAQLLSSEPLSPAFIRDLFPAIPADAKAAQTQQIVFKLKEIGEGKSAAIAILTPTEADTLAKVSAAWAKGVKTIALSKPIPSARVVLFDQGWRDAAKFKAALLAAGSDPKAKEVLQEMRLKGFAE